MGGSTRGFASVAVAGLVDSVMDMERERAMDQRVLLVNEVATEIPWLASFSQCALDRFAQPAGQCRYTHQEDSLPFSVPCKEMPTI